MATVESAFCRTRSNRMRPFTAAAPPAVWACQCKDGMLICLAGSRRKDYLIAVPERPHGDELFLGPLRRIAGSARPWQGYKCSLSGALFSIAESSFFDPPKILTL